MKKKQNKAKKPIKFSYSFSAEDITAIVASLQLVPAAAAETETPQSISEIFCRCLSAMGKLADGNTDLTPNEVYVVALSIELAVDFLSGRIDFDVDQETVSVIKPHFFTYNHLYEAFGPLLDQVESQADS